MRFSLRPTTYELRPGVPHAEKPFDRPPESRRRRRQPLVGVAQSRMAVLDLPQRAGDLLAVADEADLAGARGVERFAEVAIEIVVAAEVHVLQAARVRIDALRRERLEAAGRVE